MPSWNRLSRRDFIRLSSAGMAAATFAPAPARPASFKEAPGLAELVKAGKLPPVERRLPPNPVVVKPTNAVGRYGGTIYATSLSPESPNDVQTAFVSGLFRFSNDLSQVIPEVAEGFDFSNGFKTCTIKLRKGIRWSDGHPLTSDDVMFWFEDWQFNKDLSPTLNAQWQPGGKPMKVTRTDDYTVRFDFEVPNPAFSLIHYAGSPNEPYRPKHFLKGFHLKYNPNADKEAKTAGFDNWRVRFLKMAGAEWNQYFCIQELATPVLAPWRPVKYDTQHEYFERNPYYFKVDTAGNQLPYVDKVVLEYVSNLEVTNLKTISGGLTISGMDLLLSNYPVLKQNEKQGKYRTVLVNLERGSDVAIAFNQHHPDPVLRKIFGDVRFRRAMSVAIDRNEVNELVFLGQGIPRQATMNESASFYRKEWADAYAQYDLALANKMLDELGLTKKGTDGIRLRSDGKPLAIQLEYLPQEGPKKEVCELVVKHWAKAGVRVDAAGRDRNFLLTRLNSGQHDASAWHVDRQLERAAWAYGGSQKLGPGGNSAILYCKGWVDWFKSGGKSGVEPPAEAKELFEAYAIWQQTNMGTAEYKKAGTKVYDIIARELWVIGVIGESAQPLVIKSELENVFPAGDSKKKLWFGAANWFWNTLNGEQWFFKA